MAFEDTGLPDDFDPRLGAGGPAQISTMDRIGYYLGTAIPRAAEGIGASIGGLTGQDWGGSIMTPDLAIPPSESASGKILMDLALGGLLPAGLQLALPMGAAKALGTTSLAARAPVAARMIEDAAGFGFLGAQMGGDVAAEQAGEGALYGALTALPRLRRVLPAAALAGLSKMFFDSKDPSNIVGDWSMGDISGAAGFLTAFLPGQIGKPALQQLQNPSPLRDYFTPDAQVAGNMDVQRNVTGLDPMTRRSAADSAGGMQAAWEAEARAQGWDPNAVGNADLFGALGLREVGPSAELSARWMQDAKDLRLQVPKLQPNEQLLLGMAGSAENDIRLQSFNDIQSPYQINARTPIDTDPIAAVRSDVPKQNALQPFDPAVAVNLQKALEAKGIEMQLSQNQWIRLNRGFEALGIKDTEAKANAVWQLMQHAESSSGPRPVKGKVIEPTYTSELGPVGGPSMANVPRQGMKYQYRSEGGSIDSELLQALGLGAIRGGAGATFGGLVAANDNNPSTDPFTTALLTGGLFAFGPKITRASFNLMRDAVGPQTRKLSSSEAGGLFMPAFKTPKGRIINGQPGQGHWDIIDELTEAESADPALVHGFVDENGKFYTREEAFTKKQMDEPNWEPRWVKGQLLSEELQPLANVRGTDSTLGVPFSPRDSSLSGDYPMQKGYPIFKGVEEGIPYEQMGDDFYLEDRLWREISPEGDSGGVLSAPEAARRLKALGYEGVQGQWTSGRKTNQIFNFDDLLKKKKLRDLQPLQNRNTGALDIGPGRDDRLLPERNSTPEEAAALFERKGEIADEVEFNEVFGFHESVPKGTTVYYGHGLPARVIDEAGDKFLVEAYNRKGKIQAEWVDKDFLYKQSPTMMTPESRVPVPDGREKPTEVPEILKRFGRYGIDAPYVSREEIKIDDTIFALSDEIAKNDMMKFFISNTPDHFQINGKPLWNESTTHALVTGQRGTDILADRLVRDYIWTSDPKNLDFTEAIIGLSDNIRLKNSLNALRKEHNPSGIKMKAPTGGSRSAATTPEFAMALGRTAMGSFVGGTVGGLTDEPGSNRNFATGAILGGLATLVGPSAVKLALSNSDSALKTTKATGTLTMDNLIAQSKLNIFRGSDALADRVVSRADSLFGMSIPEGFKRILGQAKGSAADQLRTLDESFRKMSLGFKPSEDLRKDVMAFLEGNQDLQQLQNKYAAAGDETSAYIDLANNARGAIDGLIEVAASGIGGVERAEMMLGSRKQYMRQSYKLFTDSSFSPSEQATQVLADKIVKEGTWKGMSREGVYEALRQYSKEVQQQKGAYRKSTSLTGKSIDQTVFFHRKKLDKEWTDFLGEITDPVERVNLTIMKLRPMAEASKFMSKIIEGADSKTADGLPYTFADRTSKEAFLAQLKKDAGDAPTAAQSAQMAELQQYTYLADDMRYGAARNRLVHRHVADVIKAWDESSKVDSAMGRAMLGLNSFMKANVTYRNPIGIIRQFASAPVFAMIARSDWNLMGESLAAIRDPSHPLHREIIQNGIVNVDAITKDVYREIDQMTGGISNIKSTDAGKAFLGSIDSRVLDAAGKVKNADLRIADWFRLPDNVVRVSAYLSAKNRIAQQIGKAIDDPEVINKAIEFTNRYTMNYEHLPQAVKAGRHVPGVNLFLSYTAEMARIAKNLGEDLIKGDAIGGPGSRLNAALALGLLVAIPETVQGLSESNLSEEDRKDWDTVKKNLPGYAKNRFYFVTGRDKKTKQFSYVDFSSLIPTDQFNQTGRALLGGDVSTTMQVNPVIGWDNSPLFNIVGQQVLGRDRITQREFRGWPDRFANIAKELGGPLTPKVGSIWRGAEQAFSENSDGGLGITDKSGRTLTPQDFLLPYMTSLRSGTYDLDAIKRNVIARAKNEIANETAYLNDVLRSNVSDEKKTRAYERALQATIEIQEMLRQSLGLAETGSPK